MCRLVTFRMRLLITRVQLRFFDESEGDGAKQDFTYSECSLKGYIDMEVDDGESGRRLMSVLEGITKANLLCIWKDECWRQTVVQENYNYMSSTSEATREIWVRRYVEPAHLRETMCLRMFSAQHHAAPPDFPTNVRRVREATVSPSFTSILQAIGFKKNKASDVYVKCQMFHVRNGTPEHIMTLVQKHFKDKDMTAEVFRSRYLVEVKGRCEADDNLERVSKCVVEFSNQLKPFVIMTKIG